MRKKPQRKYIRTIKSGYYRLEYLWAVFIFFCTHLNFLKSARNAHFCYSMEKISLFLTLSPNNQKQKERKGKRKKARPRNSGFVTTELKQVNLTVAALLEGCGQGEETGVRG